MRRRRSRSLSTLAILLAILLLAASSVELQNHWADQPGHVTLLAAGPLAAPLPAAPPAAPPAPAANLDMLAGQVTRDADRNGADITFSILDRHTGRVVSGGDRAAFPIASVTKLFIADDLLERTSAKGETLSPEDQRGLELMLRSSADVPASDFWVRGGGNAIVDRVVSRYGLPSTTAPYNGDWWNTMSTTTDLVRYYDMLLDGTGGLPPGQADVIISNLAASTPLGIDGYPQRFGIPDALFAEPVAVKQGWMCCWNGPNQLHMSTGVVGSDRRYVMAFGSMQSVGEAAARDALTQAVKTMFPGGQT